MSNYVTTNIRLPEEDYLRLKEEATKRRKSFAAVVRDRISEKKYQKKSSEELIKNIRKHAAQNARYLEGVDIVKVLREMRYSGKW
ncbi:hypothetical protein HYZ70_00045 [Candidatus Curtissbacteria bacterium]|nr:hypothetical protein [Candidatus Curtissbacteria bacterium]